MKLSCSQKSISKKWYSYKLRSRNKLSKWTICSLLCRSEISKRSWKFTRRLLWSSIHLSHRHLTQIWCILEPSFKVKFWNHSIWLLVSTRSTQHQAKSTKRVRFPHLECLIDDRASNQARVSWDLHSDKAETNELHPWTIIHLSNRTQIKLKTTTTNNSNTQNLQIIWVCRHKNPTSTQHLEKEVEPNNYKSNK